MRPSVPRTSLQAALLAAFATAICACGHLISAQAAPCIATLLVTALCAPTAALALPATSARTMLRRAQRARERRRSRCVDESAGSNWELCSDFVLRALAAIASVLPSKGLAAPHKHVHYLHPQRIVREAAQAVARAVKMATGWIGPRSIAPVDTDDEEAVAARRRAATEQSAVPLRALPMYIVNAALRAHRGVVGDACPLHDALRLGVSLLVSASGVIGGRHGSGN
jgi:hypothetical protein